MLFFFQLSQEVIIKERAMIAHTLLEQKGFIFISLCMNLSMGCLAIRFAQKAVEKNNFKATYVRQGQFHIFIN